MHLLQPVASSSLSLPASSYIYALSASSSSADGPLATISSDDSLRLFDSRSLQLVSVVSANTHEGVTSLKNYSGDGSGHSQGLLATAGRDGAIRFWDARAGQGPGKAAVEMKTGMYSPSVDHRHSACLHHSKKQVPESFFHRVIWREPHSSLMPRMLFHNQDVLQATNGMM